MLLLLSESYYDAQIFNSYDTGSPDSFRIDVFDNCPLWQKSMKNFSVQQETIAKLNGYMEEMMDGQKVVKVFVHEDSKKRVF